MCAVDRELRLSRPLDLQVIDGRRDRAKRKGNRAASELTEIDGVAIERAGDDAAERTGTVVVGAARDRQYRADTLRDSGAS